MNGSSKKITAEDCLIKEKDHIKGVNHDRAAEMILQHADILRLAETGENYIYKDGVYVPFAWAVLESKLYEGFKGWTKDNGQALMSLHTINEILNQAFSLRTMDMRKSPELNVKNGRLNLDCRGLIDHMPEVIMLSMIDVKYDLDAECPSFMDFLDEALDPKYHDSMGELFGYILWPDHNIHKAFMLFGPKRSGKCTTLRVMPSLVGGHSTLSTAV